MDDFLLFFFLVVVSLLILPTNNKLFQSLKHQEGNLKVWLFIKIGYYILPNPPTTLIPGATNFQLLRVIADKLYYNVTDVRTRDDTLVKVKLMIFFELEVKLIP